MSGQIVAASDEFALALKAAKVTAFTGKGEEPTLKSVHIHSDRRPGSEGSGESDMLVFTSYNGTSVGQYAIEVSGSLTHPVLLDLSDAAGINKIVVDAQKKMRKEAGKQAELQVRLSLGKSEAGSETLKVQPITDGAPGKYDAHYGPVLNDEVESYPIDDAMIWLSGVPESAVRNNNGQELPQGAALVVSAEQSKVMNGIQSTFKDDNVFCYPLGHDANRRILTCNNWRGSVPGAQYDIDSDLDTPEIDVLVPPTSEVDPTSGDLVEKRTGDSTLAASTAHIEILA